MKRIEWGRLGVAVGICQGAGIVGAVFTSQSVKSWYPALNKPGFTPPSWLFGPAWIGLFLLMGISLYLVWRARQNQSKTEAIKVFWVQLILNIVWSMLFFGLKSPLLALMEIMLLWFFIGMTMKRFMRVSPIAGWLLVPYLLWVSFAMVLNFAIVRLN